MSVLAPWGGNGLRLRGSADLSCEIAFEAVVPRLAILLMQAPRGRPRCARLAATLALVIAATAQPAAQDAQELFDRAVADFGDGQLEASLVGFDEVAWLEPSFAPHLWQRGVALYYVGRYEECRHQFESHQTVNPNDVENAAWHFLCVARAESPEQARAALLPVGPDARLPMRQTYDMFRGTAGPFSVLTAAGRSPQPSSTHISTLACTTRPSETRTEPASTWKSPPAPAIGRWAATRTPSPVCTSSSCRNTVQQA